MRKDPNAVLDFNWDWTEWLATNEDVIQTISIETNGVDLKPSPAPTTDGLIVTAWLSGGVAGTRATARCRITTSAGRTDDRTINITIRER